MESVVCICIGQWIGIFEYMFFEQVEVGFGDVDICLDVYLFGVIFYELFVGEQIYEGELICFLDFVEMWCNI